MDRKEASIRLRELLDSRDKILIACAEQEAQRTELIAQIDVLNRKLEKLSAEISAAKGGSKWIELKSEIGYLYSRGIRPAPVAHRVTPVQEAVAKLPVPVQTKASWFKRLLQGI